MITGTLKNQIDKIWDDMYSYGLANPLTVIDQLTSLFFIKSLDDIETANEKKAALLPGAKWERIFPDTEEGQLMRWSKFCNLKAEEIHSILGEKVFPFIQNQEDGLPPRSPDLSFASLEEAKARDSLRSSSFCCRSNLVLVE